MPASQKKSFGAPDESMAPPKARVDIIRFGDMVVAQSTLEPGWRWSEHFKSIAGTESAQDTHFSYIVSGRFHITMDDGSELDLAPGDVAIIRPGHDAWVVGDEPCVSFDFQGASRNG